MKEEDDKKTSNEGIEKDCMINDEAIGSLLEREDEIRQLLIERGVIRDIMLRKKGASKTVEQTESEIDLIFEPKRFEETEGEYNIAHKVSRWLKERNIPVQCAYEGNEYLDAVVFITGTVHVQVSSNPDKFYMRVVEVFGMDLYYHESTEDIDRIAETIRKILNL